MFDLKSISKTRRLEAPKIAISGLPKVGKSTFAASIPGAVFIPTELGLSGLDAQAFPLAQSLDDVYSAIGTLLNEDHDFKACVLDSADWCEGLVHAHVCKANSWKDVEAPGYGKGYVAAAAEWRNVLDGLEALRTQRNMAVVIICHVRQQTIDSPTHDSYTSWTLKTHAKVAALIEEYVDVLAYAAHRIAIKKTDAGFGQKDVKALKTGERMLYLESHPAYPSGNRFGLVDCPLSWEALATQFAQATNPQPQAA